MFVKAFMVDVEEDMNDYTLVDNVDFDDIVNMNEDAVIEE